MRKVRYRCPECDTYPWDDKDYVGALCTNCGADENCILEIQPVEKVTLSFIGREIVATLKWLVGKGKP